MTNRGLTEEQVRQQLECGNVNISGTRSSRTVGSIVKENVLTYFNLIFLVLAILLIAAGSFRSLTFLPVIIINTLIGIFQEIHSKKILDDLAVLHEPSAKVIRDGIEKTVHIDRLVLGDVIHLKAGNQICADAVVLDGEISVNESLLTGEADEIVKGVGKNLMSGSFAVSGECYARLVRVGSDSYISKLTAKAREMKKSEQSEMIRSIDRLIMAAGVIIVPIGITLFIQGYVIQKNDFSHSIESMVAAVIGMIPEGLYLLVSVALAMSAARLAHSKVMLHDMRSVETLARADVLCVDKTGTITDNDMRVCEVVPSSDLAEGEFENVKNTIGSYLDALPDDNITMRAMRLYFLGRRVMTVKDFTSFSSKTKYSRVVTDEAEYRLGAPEMLLHDESLEQNSELIKKYTSQGLRVMAFVSIREGKLRVLAFVILLNSIRPNAKKTFGYFERQGVEVKVISGDDPLTVAEVAKRAGIKHTDAFINAAKLKSEHDIFEAVRKYTVFGRVSPEQKQQIVRALKAQGKTVAMTGDGVNDILAMKDADCSIAFGSGSDAAMQASQVVLLDSDFSHMTQIVSEGRRDINNIGRSATLFLVKNIFSLLLSVFSIISVMTYPLEPTQISLISAFNIGIPAFFLALEPNEKKQKKHFLRRVLLRAMPAALTDFFAIAALVLFGNVFGVSATDISVAATFLLAIVGFMILFNISAPVNRYHMGVITGCIAGLVFTAYFFSSLFAITYVSKECIMLFVLFAIATEPFMRYLTKLFVWFERKLFKN